jgi:transposase InsO family protein
LTTARKRELVSEFHEREGYPVAKLGGLLGLPRSSYYRRPVEPDEQGLREAIEMVCRQFASYGSRRVTRELRRAPYRLTVNRKRIRRLMGQMGLRRTQKPQKRHTTDSRHGFPRYPNRVADLEVGRPDEVWVSDITYIRLGQGFVYLAVIMDVFTRAIRGWNLSRSLDRSLTVKALQRALRRGVPKIHHSDQGVQYASTDYTELLQQHQVEISMSRKGSPEENPYAERLIRTIKEEEVDLSDYRDFAEAQAEIGHFIEEVYQRKRIHSSLGYLTPSEYEDSYTRTHLEQMSSLSVG